MNECPACGSASLERAAAFPFSDLRRLWFERSEIDIATCLERPFTQPDVALMRCRECLLEFFPAALCGTAALYDHLGRFDYYYQSEKWETQAALDALEGAPARAVEVGCGPGRFIEALRRRYPEADVVGLEVNPQAAADAKDRGHDVRLTSLGQLASQEPSAFDAVYAFQVLEHVPAPQEFLRDAAALLKPAGRLVIAVPNADGFTSAAVNDFGNLPPHHLSRWRARVFDRVAPAHGLDVVAVHEEPVAPYHREWYRTVAVLRLLTALARKRWNLIELGTGYRLLNAVASRLQRAVPAAVWRYRRPGHTMLVVLEKRA